MAELASLDRKGMSHSTLDWATADLADALDEPLNDVRLRLARLLAVHRAEWDDFVAAQGSDSFLARFAELVSP
jgi:hypothetical protein